MRPGALSPIAVGAVLAVLAVAAVGVAFYLGSVGPAAHTAELAADARVVLIVVAPDAQGVTLPVCIAVYPALASGPASESVDPGQRATVSGTSAHTLAGAYPFGGGKAVAEAYGATHSVATPHWIAIDA